ncbi:MULTISPECIES: hypothetical protein [unclassified Acetobacterium]|jgi:hypothetical protein|uniref:hypothetical protein n=1 Tax=unclassified Acetobacterium TaxID=2638182 RepID=UPI000DBEBD49|nr:MULTISPECIES: hypothetical protein [unclassified Acetobacterium]AWW28435.1 hypothetical protein DOZ58_18320 [Acetobacterium sp. KB-1]MDZ5726867.1 hypothetical protein [Acetobacterium sp. K1/6]
MPKNKIYKKIIDKKIFRDVLKYKKSSIRKLGEVHEIDCTERTIRRSLNEGKMTPKFLEQIAKYLDIDPKFLSGQLHRERREMIETLKNKTLGENFFYNLHPAEYPYFRKEQDDLLKESITVFLKKLFSLFDISYAQFEEMDFKKQYEVQHDLFEAIKTVISKHFEQDGYGNKYMFNLDKITSDLENYYENYYIQKNADEQLREKFLSNPPKGYTKNKILTMTPEELIDLDMWKDYKPSEDKLMFDKKYEEYEILN